MKSETKLKILHWVEKLLKLKRPDNAPFIIEERQVQRIKSEHLLSPIELEMFHLKEEEYMNHLKQDLAISMVKVMQQIGAIKYEINTDFNSGDVKITATTYVPEKL